MRLFIAAKIPEEVESELRTAQTALKKAGGSITPARDLHLTYIFLDEVPDKKVPELVKQLEQVKVGPIKTSLAQIGFFPDNKNPNVIWAGLENREQIVDQRERIAAAIGQDKSKFVAHLTLCRVKRSTPGLVAKAKSMKLKPLAWTFNGFSLIASIPVNGTREYQVIRTYD